jgi:hypothetical protein
VPYLNQDWIHGLSPSNTTSFRPRIYSSVAIQNEQISAPKDRRLSYCEILGRYYIIFQHIRKSHSSNRPQSYLISFQIVLTDSSSLLFAPSTIAISALILSFSILHMDCSEWLSSLPNFCLHFDDKTSSSNAPDHRFYDIDCCLRSFKNINGILSRSQAGQKSSRTSPTSVAAGPESSPPRASFQPIPRSSAKRKYDNVAQDDTCPDNDRKLLKPSFEAPGPLAPRNLHHESLFQGNTLFNALIPTAKRGDNYIVENNDITLRAAESQIETITEPISGPPSLRGK